MGAAREGADIWFMLSGRWSYNGQWRGRALFTRRFWRNEYVWHDSFGKYWARAYTCRFWGHLPPRVVSDPGEPLRMHCFRCETSTYPESAP
jgi:hypothetical protein